MPWSAGETIKIHDAGATIHVELNRPEVRNLIDQLMVDELHTVCADLERDPGILILSRARLPWSAWRFRCRK